MNNTIAKSTIESELTQSLEKKGITTIKSIEEFPPTLSKDSVSREAMMNAVKSKGSDAILTVSLLKKETESRYVDGTYAPMQYYNYYYNFWGYYTYWYPYIYNPGYYTSNDVYYLETNLYDSNSEVLLWSAQSKTYSYNGLINFGNELSNAIVKQMEKDGILAR